MPSEPSEQVIEAAKRIRDNPNSLRACAAIMAAKEVDDICTVIEWSIAYLSTPPAAAGRSVQIPIGHWSIGRHPLWRRRPNHERENG